LLYGIAKKPYNRVGENQNFYSMHSTKKKTEKQISLDGFKANAKSIESSEILEMITDGIADDCHVEEPVTDPSIPRNNSACDGM